jgi:hypothetical protein
MQVDAGLVLGDEAFPDAAPARFRCLAEFRLQILRRIALPPSKPFVQPVLLLAAGVALGLVAKVLDSTPSNWLPHFLEALDLRNFLSRTGVWHFLGVLIAVNGRTPARAALNAGLFFAGMVGSYYWYTIAVAGFFPKDYMMVWIGMTCLTPFAAYGCWYAKGKGVPAVILSSVIVMLLARQAFSFGLWYFFLRPVPDAGTDDPDAGPRHASIFPYGPDGFLHGHAIGSASRAGELVKRFLSVEQACRNGASA